MSRVSFRLATYNVHGCVGRDGRFAPERTARVVADLGADVAVLQEVVSGPGSDAGAASAFAAVAGSFDGHRAWAPTFETPRRVFGNLLLSRWPIVSSAVVDLAVHGREPRNAIDARLAAPFGTVEVIGTHLGLRARERREQANTLSRLVAESVGPGPLVLAGDLNAWHRFSVVSRTMRRVLGHWHRVATYPTTPWPVFALDVIMLRAADARLTVGRHMAPPARLASDHFPLVADLSFDADAAAPRVG